MDEDNDEDEDRGVTLYKEKQGKEAEITLPGRRRKLVTATGYDPTSDSGESSLCKMQNFIGLLNLKKILNPQPQTFW